MAGVWLWIDALCIDQTNIPERNDQVTRMRDLYAGAAKIIIWLGLPPTTSSSAPDAQVGGANLAVTIILQVSDESVRNVEGESRESLRGRVLAFCHDRLTRVNGDNGWTAVQAFLTNDYWNRVWCLQEISTPDTTNIAGPLIWYGTGRILLLDVVIATSYMEGMTSLVSHTSLDVHPFQRMDNVRYRRRGVEKFGEIGLLDLFDNGRSMDASDARDKVFGLLGIVRGETTAGLQIDYENTVEDVYQEMVKWHVEKTQTLNVLGLCGMRSDRLNQTLPSWAPDLVVASAKPLWKEFHDMAIIEEKVYDACKGKECSVTFSNPGRKMHLRGVLFDTISKVSLPRSTAGHTDKEITKAWIEFTVEDAAAKDDYVGGGSKTDAFKHAIVADVSDADFSARRGEEVNWGKFDRAALEAALRMQDASAGVGGKGDRMDHELLEAIDRAKEEGRDLGKYFEDQENTVFPDDVFVLSRTATSMTQYRRLVWTKKGYLGLAPASAAVNDYVCILFGGSVPFVLRKGNLPSSQERHFKLVGECYVHGIMDGEVLAKKPQVMEFVLV